MPNEKRKVRFNPIRANLQPVTIQRITKTDDEIKAAFKTLQKAHKTVERLFYDLSNISFMMSDEERTPEKRIRLSSETLFVLTGGAMITIEEQGPEQEEMEVLQNDFENIEIFEGGAILIHAGEVGQQLYEDLRRSRRKHDNARLTRRVEAKIAEQVGRMKVDIPFQDCYVFNDDCATLEIKPYEEENGDCPSE